MRGLRYLNSVLTVLAVLLALQLWTTWNSGESVLPQAQATGIPDAGAQRQQIVDQLKLLNSKTDQMNKLMSSGKMRVTVVGGDEPKQDPNKPKR